MNESLIFQLCKIHMPHGNFAFRAAAKSGAFCGHLQILLLYKVTIPQRNVPSSNTHGPMEARRKSHGSPIRLLGRHRARRRVVATRPRPRTDHEAPMVEMERRNRNDIPRTGAPAFGNSAEKPKKINTVRGKVALPRGAYKQRNINSLHCQTIMNLTIESQGVFVRVSTRWRSRDWSGAGRNT